METPPPSLQADRFAHLDFVDSPVFVLAVGADQIPRYVAFNAKARAIAGRPLSDYLGKTAAEIYEDAYGRTALERHTEVAKSGKAITYEILLPIGGQERSISTTLLPQLDDTGNVALLFGTSVDLTAEQAAREAQLLLQTKATEMEQFIAMAAHDLRAPLRNMAMIADMLGEEFVDHGDGKVELIGMLENVAAKSMTLIGDVLDHAHALDATDTSSQFNFAALCRDICDVLDPQEEHRFTYTGAEVITDRTAMQIAVRNIIDNAIKHGGKEMLSIDIMLQRGQNGMLDVVMTDNGTGFTAAALAFINGGNFKVDSGYGLLGVRRMIQARGGSMTAQNLEGASGAVIHFSLPGKWVHATNSLGDVINGWHHEDALITPKIA